MPEKCPFNEMQILIKSVIMRKHVYSIRLAANVNFAAFSCN